MASFNFDLEILNNYPVNSRGISCDTIFREIEQDNCFIIQQIDNKKIVNLSVDIFSLHFFFPRTKLRIPHCSIIAEENHTQLSSKVVLD